MAGTGFVGEEIRVESHDVIYTDSEILSYYNYNDSQVRGNTIIPTTERLVFKTHRHLPKTGFLMIGWGGNNGTTLTAGILANKLNVSWNTKEGLNHPNYLELVSTINSCQFMHHSTMSSHYLTQTISTFGVGIFLE